MSYKCKLCDLEITEEELLKDDWCCGRCTLDDYEDLNPIQYEPSEEVKEVISKMNTFQNAKLEVVLMIFEAIETYFEIDKDKNMEITRLLNPILDEMTLKEMN